MERSPAGSSPEQGQSEAQWRHEIPIPIDDSDWVDDDDERVGTAWMQLQLVHTSFRHMDTKEYRELSARLEAIERLFMDRDGLEQYYRQCYAPEDRPPTGETGAVLDSTDIRHMVSIQAQFLEDMFYVLELDRHANAPDNRGWMNLFRRWGRSPTFNRWFNDLRSTLSLGFLEFYDLYLRDHRCRIDEKPVPHPWDAEPRRIDDRGGEPPQGTTGGQLPPVPTGGEPGPCGKREPADESKRQLPEFPRLFPGLFLDSGIKEVGERDPTEPSTRSGQGIGGSGGGGQEGPKSPESGVTRGPVDPGPSPTGTPGGQNT